MRYMRIHIRLTFRRYLFVRLSFMGFWMLLAAVHGGFCMPEKTGNRQAVQEVSFSGGWRFLFAGDDTSTHYLHCGKSVKRPGEPVTVPHVFPCNNKNGKPREGYGWYFNSIAVPDSMEQREMILYFEGVSLYAEVFVNGRLARGPTFACMPFSVNCTPFLESSDTLHLAVRVDNRLRKRSIPDDKARGWRVYGGINREVSVSIRPRDRIGSVSVRTFHISGDTFDLQCRCVTSHGNPWDRVTGAVIAPVGRDTLSVFSFSGRDTTVRIAGILPWTPDNPNQYRLSFTPFFGGREGMTTTFLRGFCRLTARGSGLFLNGKPVYLRGIARHDILDLSGKPLTREQRRKDLAEIKSLGVNFLRIAHFPQHRDIYELCDSIGLLVMDEIPAWKTDKKYLATGDAREYGTAYMNDLIDEHGNFTCICLWSIGNQFKSYKTSVADYVGAVASAVRRNDPSRLVTFCSYYYLWDKAFRYVDVISVNEYFGWELASLDMLPPMLERIQKEWPDKPLLVTELGAQAKYGLRNETPRLAGPVKSMLGKDISEDHQALFIGAHMDTIWNRREIVSGMVVWAYADYMCDLKKRRTPDMPPGINACGIVTADRKRKRAYRVVKENYTRYMDELDRISLQTDCRADEY